MDREHPASPSRYGAHVHLSQSVQEKRRGPQRKPGSSPHGSASRSANYPSPAAQMRFLGPHEGRGGQRHDRSTPSGKMLGPEPHHRKPHAHHAAHSSVPHAQRCQNTTPTLLSQALKRRIHSSLRVLCFEFFFENSPVSLNATTGQKVKTRPSTWTAVGRWIRRARYHIWHLALSLVLVSSSLSSTTTGCCFLSRFLMHTQTRCIHTNGLDNKATTRGSTFQIWIA